MDEIGNRALLIGVGVLVTLMVATAVFLVIGQIGDLYKGVAETDVSIEAKFKEMNKYDNNTFLGIDVLNTFNKFKTDDSVDVCIDVGTLNCNELNVLANFQELDYNKKYISILEQITKGYRITFKLQ